MGKSVSSTQLSSALFGTISWFAFAYGLFAGIHVTADCLSDEKREGTLGLLFLTDLKGYDVVLGKLVATSVNSFYRLLAIFPVLAIPLLLGGLTPGEFWRVVLVLCNTLFLSLSAGMLMSALSRQERKAMAGTLLLILLLTGGAPLLGLIISSRQGAPFNPAYALPSAAYTFSMAFEKQFATGPNNFWSSVSMTHSIGWIFLGLASVIVPYSWKDKPAGVKRVVWRERLQLWKYGTTAVRHAFRTRLLEVNPFFWLAGRDRLKPAYVCAFLGAAAAGWLWLFFKYSKDLLTSESYIPTALILHTVLKFWVAAEACRPLAEERRSGTLELLLSTPLTVPDILRGQMLALKRQFGGPVMIVLLIDLVMFIAGRNDRFVDSTHDWMMLCIAGILTFLADLYTIAWVGMWLGLTAKRATWASSGALMRVLVLPWIIFTIFTSVMVFSSRWSEPQNFLLGAWFAISILTDLFFFSWARGNLLNGFRMVVAQRFETKPRSGWWKLKETNLESPREPVNA